MIYLCYFGDFDRCLFRGLLERDLLRLWLAGDRDLDLLLDGEEDLFLAGLRSRDFLCLLAGLRDRDLFLVLSQENDLDIDLCLGDEDLFRVGLRL